MSANRGASKMPHHAYSWSTLAFIPASLLAVAQASEPSTDGDFSAQYALAEKALKNNQPSEALKIFSNLEKKFTQTPAKVRALFLLQKAHCYYQQKDWKYAANTLQEFLTKFPKGTEDLLATNDNKIIASQFTLAEVQRQLGQWELALEGLNRLANSPLAAIKDRSTACRVAANFIQERAASGTPAEKTQSQQLAVELLRRAVSAGLNTPEGKLAGSALIELYLQLHRLPEAQALQMEMESSFATSPTEWVRTNRLRVLQGDAYFNEAHTTSDPKQKTILLQNALHSYQAVLPQSVIQSQIQKAAATLQNSLTQLEHFSTKPSAVVADKIATLQTQLQECAAAEAALQSTPNYNQVIYYRIGLCLHELQMPYEAIVAFREILNTDPLSPQAASAAYYLILSEQAIGKQREAQTSCRTFIERYPEAQEISNVALLAGALAQDRQDYREALNQYQWVKTKLKKLKPEVAEEIDYRCGFARFCLTEWNQAHEALTAFIKKYPKSAALEQVTYLQALTQFYLGQTEAAQKSLSAYQLKFPMGAFLPDVQYRLALIEYGKVPPQFENTLKACQTWLKLFTSLNKPETGGKISDVYALIGDAEVGLAGEIERQLLHLQSTHSVATETQIGALEKQKAQHSDRALEAYLQSAQNGQHNREALNYSLTKLNPLLKAQKKFSVLRDLYLGLYRWDKKSPQAASYLFEAISATERIENQKVPANNSGDALQLLGQAIQESIDDPQQEGVEKLLMLLAQKVFLRNQRAPDGLTRAHAELETTLKPNTPNPSAIARARLYLTHAQLSQLTHQPQQVKAYYKFIAEHFSPDELSAPLLALTGESILAQGESTQAESIFNFLVQRHRTSTWSDYGFSGLANLKLEQKKFSAAVELCDEALQQGFIKNKECALRLTRGQALTELRRFTEAQKEFTYIAQNKAWRGESTATCLYWLGLIEERQNHTAEAVAYYRRCYQGWKRYPTWSAKAYWGTAQLLAKHLHQPAEATALIQEMLSHEFLKETPEGQHAQNLLSVL